MKVENSMRPVKVGGILTKTACMGSNFEAQFGVGVNTRLSETSSSGMDPPSLYNLLPEGAMKLPHGVY